MDASERHVTTASDTSVTDSLGPAAPAQHESPGGGTAESAANATGAARRPKADKIRTPAGSATADGPDETGAGSGKGDSTGSGTVWDYWGAEVDGTSPDGTLKGPGDSQSPAHASPKDTPDDESPDVSAEGYELLDVLGKGGVGVVYQAVQKSIDRKIAVKMIKPGMGRDAGQREKFLSEAMVTGRLDHPNIVPIHDLGTTKDGQPFYTMKMVKGTPWGDVIDELPLSENLRILLDVCDAVSFAHSKGVIHRDLKPDNVMLGEFGEVQLMDWGLGAQVLQDGELTSVPQAQAAGGTPTYMAPEMVTGQDGPVGTHSDVYLLGGILFRIVTGQPPHGGDCTLDCLENAIANVIQPTDLSGPLIEIAGQAMRTNPIERHGSVKCFKQALLDYQAHAESISLCERSAEDLRQGCAAQDYETFAQALYGFREALRLWDANADAGNGIIETRLEYARCAYRKSDLDLAASMLDAECAEHQRLLAEVRDAQHRRAVAKRRFRLVRAVALTLTALVILILTIASIWISAAHREAVAAKEAAVAAKEAAVAAQQAESEQREVAESAMARAQDEEARAVRALADLERAFKDLVAAQEQERRALAKAEASDRVATQTRDELAKSGMLLDNSWWVFDAETAERKQAEAAAAINLPVELTIAVSADVVLDLVLIPPGSFVMGSPPKEANRAADEHLHRVTHTRPFFIGKYELTEAQWQALTGSAPASAAGRAVDARLPVAEISVEEIVRELLPPLQKLAPNGYEFRLPSEAEWEYACRGGTSAAYHTGEGENALDKAGWYVANSDRKVQPIGGKAPNAFGLCDMHGNVAEICVDRYEAGFYLESPITDPIGARAGEFRVLRGGSILNTSEHCRSAYRSYVFDQNRYSFHGVRLALVPIRDDADAADTDPSRQPPAGR